MMQRQVGNEGAATGGAQQGPRPGSGGRQGARAASGTAAASRWRRARSLLRWGTVAASWLFALFVVGYVAALRLFGETWWVTTVAMYLPHWVLLAPLAALALAALSFGPRLLLLLHAGAAFTVLFPLMGLVLWGANDPTPGAPRLRVVSYNVGSGARSIGGMVEQIVALQPDLVLLQESAPEVNEAVANALPDFSTWSSTQFFVASRGPILDSYEPPKVQLKVKLEQDDARVDDRSPRFVRVTAETPLGKLDIYNVHPISPREALTSVHDESFLGALRSGDHRVISNNTSLRDIQAETIAELAATSANPVLIAGDTNLPHGSRILEKTLGRWQDGFSEVGFGLGYTFPVTRKGPWMRIDRIFAGPELRFLQVGVGESGASDHHCVWAELERAAQ